MEGGPGEVTQLLARPRAGENSVRERLLELVYEELRRMATARMRAERDFHTLIPAALVHEAYLRFGDGPEGGFKGRAHFLAIASQAMRRVLVDHARARGALKRAGRETSIGEDLKTPTLQSDEDVIALDEALDTLKALSPRQSQVVELRYFGGLPSRKWRRCLG
jgi:RNA polymerase sigma-70 factor, ECF subfamily